MIGTVVPFFYDQAQIRSQNICGNYALFVVKCGMARIVLLFPIVIVISPTVNFIVPITLLADFFIFRRIAVVIGIFFVIIVIIFVAFLFVFFNFFGSGFGTIISNVFLFEAEFQLVNGAGVCLEIFRKVDGVGFPAAIISQIGVF